MGKIGLRWPMRAVPGGQVLAALHRHRYQRNAHHRGGEQGKWKRIFSPENLEYYHHRYGNLAERMGYEPSFPKPSNMLDTCFSPEGTLVSHLQPQ
jgi:hypothetical protein